MQKQSHMQLKFGCICNNEWSHVCKLLANLCSHFIVTNVNISLSNVFFFYVCKYASSCLTTLWRIYTFVTTNLTVYIYLTDKLAYFLQMQTSFGCIFAPKFSIVQIFHKSVMDTLVVSIPSIGEQEGFILCWAHSFQIHEIAVYSYM